MLDLLDRIEAMGRRGAWLALGLSGAGLVLAACLVTASLLLPPSTGLWTLGALRGVALLLFALAMVFGMVGARGLTGRRYAPVEEVWPSLPRDAFVQALRSEPRPLCVCARCRIHLPATYSTGACPRCASSIDYYAIDSDEDAKMVIVALS